MNNMQIIKIIVCSTFMASCQEPKPVNYVIETTVTDQNGIPLRDAEVTGGSEKIMKSSPIFQVENANMVKTTNENGKAILTLSRYSGYPSGIIASKPGYYTTRQPIAWAPLKKEESRINTTSKITLKKIINPTRMYAHSNSGSAEKIAKIKHFNVKYGFDLQYAEALPPLGKGKHADFYFTLEGSYKSKDDYNMTLKIVFPNKSDGIVAFDTATRLNSRETNLQGSFLQSDYMAPESNYKQSIIKNTWNSKNDSNPQCNNDMSKNYYFRVRTITDANGKIVSANYGKIYGDFFFDPANIEWGYLATLMLVDTYFNPSTNDRNVEFDTKNNLLQNSNVIHP